jgi:hypothetical protein
VSQAEFPLSTTHLSRSGRGRSMAGVGHEDQFPPPSLDCRCRLEEPIFARMRSKEEDAPKAAIAGISPRSRGGLTGAISAVQGAPPRQILS